MKTKTLLTAVAVMLGLSVSAYADVQVSGSPVDTGRSDGISELVGRVSIGTTGSASVTDTLTFKYGGATITNTTATGISISSGLGATFVSISGDTITVNVSTGLTGTFEVSGVRVALSQVSSSTLSASVGTLPTGNLILGANTTQVLNSIVASKTVGGTGDGATSILSTGTLNDSTGQITIKEVSKANFSTSAQEGGTPGATNGYQIEMVLSAALPSGLTLDVAQGSGTSSTLTATFSPTTVSGTTTKITATITGSSQSAKETLVVAFTLKKLTGSSAPSIPLTPTSITITASSAPTGTVPASTALPATKRPAFINDPMAGGAVVNIVSSSTNLLYAFATWQPSLGFDSGIAIANTSSDWFTIGSATPTSGTISFHLFPADGSAGVTWTTPTSIAAGATYQALMSEIAAGAGLTSFTGYIIAVCNFTHGHGEGFVLDAGKIAQTLNATVIPNPAVKDRDNAIGTDGGESNGR